MDWIHLIQCAVVGFCEYDNEHSTKDVEFLK
jgi:hypothetical protein